MQKSLMAFLFGLCLLASQTYAEELKIGSWGGNVRSGPSTDYPKIGSLKNGDPVVLLKKKNLQEIASTGSKLHTETVKLGINGGGYFVDLTIWLKARMASVRTIIDRRHGVMDVLT